MQQSQVGRILGILFLSVGILDTIAAMFRRFEWLESRFPQEFKAVVTLPAAIVPIQVGIVLIWETKSRYTPQTSGQSKTTSIRTLSDEPRSNLINIIRGLQHQNPHGLCFLTFCLELTGGNLHLNYFWRSLKRVGRQIKNPSDHQASGRFWNMGMPINARH
jgi:hypothetical protein